MRICWCGNSELLPFSKEYGQCSACGTLISLVGMSDEELRVSNDETDFYGKQYWLSHQSNDLGFPDIYNRARNDLPERNLHWLKALLKYCLPPAKVLELGCSHGSFVALMRQAGFDATGIEMSPWVVEFGQKTFGVPISVGPIEALDFPLGSFDAIALMDVLEHLPDPLATMEYCLKLLKPDGLLFIQTPQFRQGIDYRTLTEKQSPFLAQLKADEHLYLFTEQSIRRLFKQLGADYIQFEPAIFSQYDMFFVVGCTPMKVIDFEVATATLLSSPGGRFVQAMLDMSAWIKVIDADREERLRQIHTLTAMVKEAQAALFDSKKYGV